MARVGEAWAWLRQGRLDQARPILEALVRQEPGFAPPRELLAYAHQMAGDLAAAEREMRAAVALDPAQPAFAAGLGVILRHRGSEDEAEQAFRTALVTAPGFPPAIEGLGRLLLDGGRAAEAAALLSPVTAAPDAPPALLALHAAALRGAGRSAEALPLAERAARARPRPPDADELLAAAQEDLGDFAAAEATTRLRLQAEPADAWAWSRLGRLQQARGEHEAAEQSFGRAVRLQPQDAALHLDLAESVWIRTGDLGRSLARLDAALRQRPTVTLFGTKVRLTGRAGLTAEAYAMAAEAVAGDTANAGLQRVAAAAAANAHRPETMLAHAKAAQAARPDDPAAEILVAEALLRLGEAGAAAPRLERLLERDPVDQRALALLALAWRCGGDPRYAELHDYPRLVRAFDLERPPGWSSREGFLADLSERLHALHRAAAPPLDQSLRGGTQTSHNLAVRRDPVLQALFAALAGPIEAYVQSLGPGKDAVRRRATGAWRFATAWSVRLRPQGFHVSHIHPDGWLSSAFYVEAPEVVRAGDRQGWLQFGDPGFPMAGRPEADHMVEPQPGRLVLFPSYMFHGTRPFGGSEPRMTVAFDVVQA